MAYYFTLAVIPVSKTRVLSVSPREASWQTAGSSVAPKRVSTDRTHGRHEAIFQLSFISQLLVVHVDSSPPKTCYFSRSTMPSATYVDSNGDTNRSIPTSSQGLDLTVLGLNSGTSMVIMLYIHKASEI